MNQNAFKVKLEFCHHFQAGEGPGLLRLHSTYRHDLKIYSSDEGRVQVYIFSTISIAARNFKLLTSIVVHPIHRALHFMLCVIFVIKRKDFFLGWYFLLLLWPN
jgi:hypothetical protein